MNKDHVWNNIHKFVEYNPETGKLYWLPRERKYFKDLLCFNRHNNQLAFKEIKSNCKGYIYFSLFDHNFLGHRVAWKIHHNEEPPEVIDHIDGDGINNKIVNLRDGTGGVNERNAKMNSNNKTGVNGVNWDKKKEKYKVTIANRGKNIHLGMYNCLAECVIARKVAEKILGYSENHGRK